jgi:hypothetical protein
MRANFFDPTLATNIRTTVALPMIKVNEQSVSDNVVKNIDIYKSGLAAFKQAGISYVINWCIQHIIY